MQQFSDSIRAALVKRAGLDAEQVRIETPRDAALGDLAFPCFQLAKQRKAPPAQVAAELAPLLEAELTDIAVAAAGPYLNFTIERGVLARALPSATGSRSARLATSCSPS